MTPLKQVVRWRFDGKEGRHGKHLTYTRAYAVFEDSTERRYDVNDVVLCNLIDDEEEDDAEVAIVNATAKDEAEQDAGDEQVPWVAQVVRFYYYSSQHAELEKQRVELRSWSRRPLKRIVRGFHGSAAARI